MKILSIDTTTPVSSVSVMEDGSIVGEFTVNQTRTHSETLLPMIKELLSLLGISVKDIDLIAVGIGPGSFTGIRIGMTVAKTLAQVLDIKITGISSLEALARNIKGQKTLSLIDARGGRTYYAIYDENGKRLTRDSLIMVDDLAKKIDGEDLVAIGQYTDETRDILTKAGVNFAPFIHNNLLSRGLIMASLDRYEKGDFDDYRTLKANYVRKSQAERDFPC